VGQVQALTIQWSHIIAGLPFTNIPPDIFYYQPRVLTPRGDAKIALQMVGPKLAGANPSLTSEGGEKYNPALVTATQLTVNLEFRKNHQNM